MSSSLRRIAIVGPESTGKSALAQALASHYQTPWVPEYAREYLAHLPRSYREADLWAIAQGQLAAEAAQAALAERWLFVDTNLLVIYIWAQFKYGRVDPRISDAMHLAAYDLHLLTDIDLPWADDPLREHPHARQELFELYQHALEEAGVPYAVISGTDERRTTHARQAIEDFFGGKEENSVSKKA